jgi:hypothetical protein
VPLDKSSEVLYAANKTKIGVLGEAEVVLNLGNLELPCRILVSNHVAEPMLGIDWLVRNKCTWAFHNGDVNIGGRTFPVQVRSASLASRRVVACRDATIPAWSEAEVDEGGV